MSSSTTTTTVLGHSARVVGDLHLDHDAVLAGEITGNVHTTAHLELAADAVVQGDLHAASLTLAGRVKGDVYVKNTTELQLGGTIQGQLDTGHLLVVQGASFEGQLRLHRPTSATPAETPPPATHAAPKLTLNRSPPRPQHHTSDTAQDPAADATFNAIPGTVNAGLRPRRRASGSPVG